MPGHWLLARLGKRVLRPGGVELTSKVLADLRVSRGDDVVEVAPGLGATTRLILESAPASYTGVDRDPAAADLVEAMLAGPNRRVVQASAADTGLADASADVVTGEAYLTMQPDSLKNKILADLSRVLRPGGRFGLHEIAFTPAEITQGERDQVAASLSSSIHVNVSPLTIREWTDLLADYDLVVEHQHTAPLHLLEPRRLFADEGIVGALRFVRNVLRDREARARVVAMRRAMRSNSDHLQAVALVATKRPSGERPGQAG